MTGGSPSVRGRLAAALQYALPRRALSRAVLAVTRIRWRPVVQLQIRWFARHYQVAMDEALEPDPSRYREFNTFFTRALRPGARPIPDDPAAVISPADGTVQHLGGIRGGALLQAKGRPYGLTELLGGNAPLAERLEGGSALTVYLAPRDYHRVHAPFDARIRALRHVPGDRFSVNPATAAHVPRLFGRNERVVEVTVCLGGKELGPAALVLVGAMMVGSIETVWTGPLTAGIPTPSCGDLRMERGQEIGRFNMGSTVILAVAPGLLEWDPALAPGRRVRVGMPVARLRPPVPGPAP